MVKVYIDGGGSKGWFAYELHHKTIIFESMWSDWSPMIIYNRNKIQVLSEIIGSLYIGETQNDN